MLKMPLQSAPFLVPTLFSFPSDFLPSQFMPQLFMFGYLVPLQ